MYIPQIILNVAFIGFRSMLDRLPHCVSTVYKTNLADTTSYNYLAGEGSILSVARHKLWLVCNVYVEWGEKVTDRDEINKFERCLQ